MKTPPQKKPKAKTQIEMAALLNVSRKTLGNWRRDGVDTTEANIEELKELAAVVDLRQATSGEIATARLRKLTAEAERMEHALAVQRGEYILREDSTKHAAHAAMASKAQWEKLEDSLPPLLDGLQALAMKAKLRDYARNVCLELSKIFN